MTSNLPLAASNKNKFKPTDEELIQIFLYNKVHGKPIPSAASNNNATILECDLYCKKSPREIWEGFGGSNSSHGGKDFYFFTKLKRKSVNGRRSDRTIGLGSWEAEDVGKPVVAKGTNQRIGLKKRFRFEKSNTSEDGAWIMHEYSIDSSLLPNPSAENNYVLCRFRKNIRHSANASEQQTSTRRTSRHEENRVTRKRKAILLATESALGSVNNDVSKDQSENGDNDIVIAETTKSIAVATTDVNIESNDEEQLQNNVLSNMTWPELFSLQLRILNKDLIQDEDIPILPNTFYNEVLSHVRED